MPQTSSKNKAYIQYCRPFKNEDDEPPISEMWTDGKRPKKKLADPLVLFVYDDDGNNLINQRPWDGLE